MPEKSAEKKVPEKSELTCPKCGRPLNRFDWGYSCSGYKDEECDFSLGFKIAHKEMPESAIMELIAGKQIHVKGLIGSRGAYDCDLKLDENGELKFIFKKDEPVYTGENCPECGKPMIKRKGKYGDFEGCSGYPDCRYIKKRVSTIKSVGTCPDCGKPLVERMGKYGKFVSCSGYPQCKYIQKGK